MGERRVEAQTRAIDAAAEFLQRLVERVGSFRIEDGVPREIRRQQWSVFNVPLMWAAAEGDNQCALLEWVSSVAERLPPVQTFRGELTGREVAQAGWRALHGVLRSWGVTSREDLSEWIHNQGFRQPRWGAHFSGRVQERMLNMAIVEDANVALLESLFVHVAVHSCVASCRTVPDARARVRRPRRKEQPVQPWEVLDDVNLADVFQQRHAVLQSCPVHLRGRFRHIARIALEARSDASLAHDTAKETRAWKLFCLLPFLLLRRPVGNERVCKAELNSRFDCCSEGRFDVLVRELSNVQENGSHRSTVMDSQTRAKAACQRVRMGEVSRARQCLTGAALAPGTQETLQEMQSKRPQAVVRPIPEDVLNYIPETPVKLDRQKFLGKSQECLHGGLLRDQVDARTNISGFCWTMQPPQSFCSMHARVWRKRQCRARSQQR